MKERTYQERRKEEAVTEIVIAIRELLRTVSYVEHDKEWCYVHSNKVTRLRVRLEDLVNLT